MNKQPAVYILANKRNGTLYVGVTSDLVKRIWEHKNNIVEGFTKDYNVHQLVWYELHESMESAIIREKRLKDWKRAWKLELIEGKNPDWMDLYDTIVRLDSGFRRNDEIHKLALMPLRGGLRWG
jgi:putative endonuclease